MHIVCTYSFIVTHLNHLQFLHIYKRNACPYALKHPQTLKQNTQTSNAHTIMQVSAHDNIQIYYEHLVLQGIQVSFQTFFTLLSAIEGMKEMFVLTTHSTHFIYGYMASDIW